MANQVQGDNILDKAYNATTEGLDEVSARGVEVVADAADRATEAVSERTANFREAAAEKTVEKTAENSTKQEVIEVAADKGQANVAASYAAASTSVAADNELSSDQKAIIEARMKEITLAQEKDIAPENMKVAINEQQRIQEKNQELSA